MDAEEEEAGMGGGGGGGVRNVYGEQYVGGGKGGAAEKNDWMGRKERNEKVGGHKNGSCDGGKKESAHERQMGRGVVLACCPTAQILDMTHTVHTVCHCVYSVK